MTRYEARNCSIYTLNDEFERELPAFSRANSEEGATRIADSLNGSEALVVALGRIKSGEWSMSVADCKTIAEAALAAHKGETK